MSKIEYVVHRLVKDKLSCEAMARFEEYENACNFINHITAIDNISTYVITRDKKEEPKKQYDTTERALKLGMVKHVYESDESVWYMANYKISEYGEYTKTKSYKDSDICIEFSDDYAQIYWSKSDKYKVITVEKCLKLVKHMNKVSEMFELLS